MNKKSLLGEIMPETYLGLVTVNHASHRTFVRVRDHTESLGILHERALC